MTDRCFKETGNVPVAVMKLPNFPSSQRKVDLFIAGIAIRKIVLHDVISKHISVPSPVSMKLGLDFYLEQVLNPERVSFLGSMLYNSY